MTAIADHLENRIINYFLRGQVDTQPTSHLVGLWTANPSDTGAGAGEVSGGSYARQAIATSIWSAPTVGTTTNSGGVITFPVATGVWGTVTHIVVFDNLSNPFFIGTLAVPKTVGVGDTFSVPTSELTITLL